MSAAIAFRCEALPPRAVLEREWRRLEAEAGISFFVSWAWIGALLATVPEPKQPRLLRGTTRGETVALALLGAATTRRRLGLIRARGVYLNETGDAQFDAMTVEHNGILVASRRREAALDALLDWFAGQREQADELHLSGVSFALSEPAARCGLLVSDAAVLPSYAVALDRLEASGGDIAAILSANARQQLRRAFRHFARHGPLSVRAAATEAEAQRWFTALKALHCASWERRRRPHAFTNPFFEQFHRRLIEASFAEGAIQLLEARAGERILGYLYNFRRDRTVYAYQSGFDDGDPRERPGYVTHALAIRHAFEQDFASYDFMAGYNRLKASFATRRTIMRWQIAQQPRLRFRLEHWARRFKQRFQSDPKFPLAAAAPKG